MHYLFFILILLFSQNVWAAPCTDVDGDGYCKEDSWMDCDNPSICAGFEDCEDGLASVNPGNRGRYGDDTCDGIDDDCDDGLDADDDGDGIIDVGYDEACDTTCDGLDQDGDGEADDDVYNQALCDSDGDGIDNQTEIGILYINTSNAYVGHTGVILIGCLDYNIYDDPSGDPDGDTLSTNYELYVSSARSNPCDPDMDEDGLTDDLELIFGTSTTDRKAGDYDEEMSCAGYDLNDLQEYTMGTDPDNYDTDGDGLCDPAEAIEYGTLPNDADSDDDGLSDYDEIVTYTSDPNDADGDDDELNDYDEIITYGTNPNNSDTDADGLTDLEEVTHLSCLNPNSSADGTGGDADSDTLTNADEIRTYKTNPCSSDTDGDALTDLEEITYVCLDPNNGDAPQNATGDADGDRLTNEEELHSSYGYLSNPCDADSDDDDLSDGQEIFDYETDPLDADSDNDALNDGEEVSLTTDPLDSDTDNDSWKDGEEVNASFSKDPLVFDNLVSLSQNNNFDGDSYSDLIAFGPDGNYCVINSNGSRFNHDGQWIKDLGDATSLSIVGDFNGDGFTDVASLKPDGTISVGLSDGTQFTSDSGWSVTGFTALEKMKTLTGDFDGNGSDDFVVYTDTEARVFVSSSKTFNLNTSFSSTFDALASADFNADGFDDLAFLSSGNIYVSLSTGAGFDAEEEWLLSFYDAASQVFTGDFDADGLEDIWVYDADDKTINVALSLGDSFRDVGSKLTSSFTENLYQVANGDFDGDGNPDVFGIYDGAKSWRGLDGDVFLGNSSFFNLDGTWNVRGFKNMTKCQGMIMPIKSPLPAGAIIDAFPLPLRERD